MADDDDDLDLGDDGGDDGGGGGGGGGAGAGAANSEETGLDADGYHVVSNRGKFQAQLNPLQLKLMAEKAKCVRSASRRARAVSAR